MKIRFKISHRPKGDAADIPTYKAGEVHNLELSYANKYIRLGYAEEAVDVPVPSVVVEEPIVVEPVVENTIPQAIPARNETLRLNKYRK